MHAREDTHVHSILILQHKIAHNLILMYFCHYHHRFILLNQCVVLRVVVSCLGQSMKCMRGPYHYITVWYMSHVKNLHSHLQTWPRLLRWCGVRTQSYDCPPHMKYVKQLLYVWSGSGMSMKWMGGRYHILQHVPSENPTQNPTGPTPLEWWYSMVLWQYDCQPWSKAFKHFL